MLKTIEQNLPALIVVLPILFAPVLALISPKKEQGRWFAWLLSFAVCGLVASAASYQFVRVEISGPVAYDFGNWSKLVGIEFVADHLNVMLVFFVAFLAFITMPYALTSVQREIAPEKTSLFYACFLLCLSGLLGMLSTNDLFNFFVFLEISSITSYALVALGKDKRALLAAFNYLIIGSIGGVFYLLGVMFVYMQTGSLNFGIAAQALLNTPDNKLIVAAFCFMSIGLMIKAGVFPLAGWLPNAYAYAPSFVSAFMAGTATKVALFALIKILFSLFDANLLFGKLAFDNILLVLALVAMFYGSLAAIGQSNIKKMLAYSSIANVGYIILGVALLNHAGLTSAIFNLVAHGVAKTGAFIAIGAIVVQVGAKNNILEFKDLAGIGKKMPYTMFLFIVFGLSLIGTPLTAGFVAKWFLLEAAMQQSAVLAFVVVAAILSSSLLAVVYVWRIVETAYFGTTKAKAVDPDSYTQMPLWVLAIAIVYFGLHPAGLLRLAENVAGGLLL